MSPVRTTDARGNLAGQKKMGKIAERKREEEGNRWMMTMMVLAAAVSKNAAGKSMGSTIFRFFGLNDFLYVLDFFQYRIFF